MSRANKKPRGMRGFLFPRQFVYLLSTWHDWPVVVGWVFFSIFTALTWCVFTALAWACGHAIG